MMKKTKEKVELLLLVLLCCIPLQEVSCVIAESKGDGIGTNVINVNIDPTLTLSPPSPFNKAATARWLAHNTGWGSLSTIQASTRERPGTPFANIASHSDGPPSQSTGTIYFLHSPLDASMEDVMENNLVSFAISEVQTGYCKGKNYDAEDPRCARLSLSGPLVQVTDPNEVEVAKEAMFSRHPAMKTWYTSDSDDDAQDYHAFTFWRLELEEIWLVDFYGGAAQISIDAWDRGTDEDNQSLYSPQFNTEVEFENNAIMASQAEVTNDGQHSRLDIFFTTLIVGGAFILGTYIGRYSISQRGSEKLEEDFGLLDGR